MDWSKLNYTLNIEEDNLEFLDYRKTGHVNKDGVQYAFRFPNGFGASVVKVPEFSQGCYDDTWELGVTKYIHPESGSFRFCGAPIKLADKCGYYPGDVIGGIDDVTVNKILRDIRLL